MDADNAWISISRPPGRFGSSLHILKSCESTNDVAMELARTGCESGTVVIAQTQTRGKGRHGRKWESWEGNIAFSIVIRPQIPLKEAHKLVMCAALATVEALESLGVCSQIKWPNDILIESKTDSFVEKLGSLRKIGGILLEVSSTATHLDAAVIGIGLNMSRPKADRVNFLLPQMGFIHDVNAELSLSDVIDALLDTLEVHLRESFSDENYLKVLNDVRKRSSLLGKKVRVEGGKTSLEGIAHDLSHDGGLIIRLDNGSSETIYFGDVHLSA